MEAEGDLTTEEEEGKAMMETERFEDTLLLAFKMEVGVMSQ